jgi:kynurenine formamidase
VHWFGLLLGLLGLTLSVACTAAPVVQSVPPVGVHRVVDLSHVVRQDVPYPPEEPLTRLERSAEGRLQQLTIGARTGTLLEVVTAPTNPVTVDLLSPRDLMLDAVVIDVRDAAQDTPGYTFSVSDLRAWEDRHGEIPPGVLVLLATGWDVRWGDPTAYLALDAAGASQAPTFSSAAAELLLTTRAVAGLGIDAPTAPALPLADHWLLLVNLTNLEQLPPTGATVMVGALKIQAADRSPARVLARVPTP